MSYPLLKADTEREIVLDEPRTAAWVLAAALGLAAVATRLLLDERWVAPALLALFAFGALTRALRVHRLRLDLERGVYAYRRGFFLAAPRRQGTLDEIAGVFIERHEAGGGLIASSLRSRVVVLEFAGWPEGKGHPEGGQAEHSFMLGFPMGPRVARDKAVDYARRLGVEVVDRTSG